MQSHFRVGPNLLNGVELRCSWDCDNEKNSVKKKFGHKQNLAHKILGKNCLDKLKR